MAHPQLRNSALKENPEFPARNYNFVVTFMFDIQLVYNLFDITVHQKTAKGICKSVLLELLRVTKHALTQCDLNMWRDAAGLFPCDLFG